MNLEDKIKQKYGTDTGFTVPEGYFEQAFSEIASKLPEHPGRQVPPQLSRWQRLKPYVYLAAMFAGIWCTMKMVTMISNSPQQEVSLDNPPTLVAEAMSNPEVVAQMTSAPSPMIVEDGSAEEVPAAATETVEIADAETDNAVNYEYADFIDVADIDLNQLQAALDSEEGPEEYYYN